MKIRPEDLSGHTNPEELLLQLEEARELYGEEGEPEHCGALESVPLGQLIEAGQQVRMHSEKDAAREKSRFSDEMKGLNSGLIRKSETEREYQVVKKLDMEFDEFDPPIETKCARYAGPFDEELQQVIPCSQERQPSERQWKAFQGSGDTKFITDPVTRAILLVEQIEKMSPRECAHSYFGMDIGGLPKYLRDFVQSAVEKKVRPLVKKLKDWKDTCLKKAKDSHEKGVIQERASIGEQLLERVLLKEDPSVREYAAITRDQGAEIDSKWTRLEACRDDHVEEEQRRILSENQDWFHQMWREKTRVVGKAPDGSEIRETIFTTNSGGERVPVLEKNMSGPEALHLARNRDEREFRVQRLLGWLERQTNKASLEAGLKKLNKVYNRSRSTCYKKKDWSEVRYTNEQVSLLRRKFRERMKEK